MYNHSFKRNGSVKRKRTFVDGDDEDAPDTIVISSNNDDDDDDVILISSDVLAEMVSKAAIIRK